MRAAWLAFALGSAIAAGCSSSDEGGNGGSGGEASGAGGTSGGSGEMFCSGAEQSAVVACAQVYEQMNYGTCPALAACLNHEVKDGTVSISEGCYNCLADHVGNKSCTGPCTCCE